MKSLILWLSLQFVIVTLSFMLLPTFYVFFFGLFFPFGTFLFKDKGELLFILHEVSHDYYWPLLLFFVGCLYIHITLMLFGLGWFFHILFESQNRKQEIAH